MSSYFGPLKERQIANGRAPGEALARNYTEFSAAFKRLANASPCSQRCCSSVALSINDSTFDQAVVVFGARQAIGALRVHQHAAVRATFARLVVAPVVAEHHALTRFGAELLDEVVARVVAQRRDRSNARRCA